jgi:Predicted nucleotide-binding protein containing TIR-like domain
MTIEFLKNDFEKVSYLLNLLVAHATGQPADSAEYEALRRELLTNPRLADALPPWVRMHRDLGSFWGFIQPKFSKYAERRTYLSEQFTPLLDELEFEGVASPHKALIKTKPANGPAIARNKRKVFIVHGHDNEAKQEIARFLEQLRLEPIILHEQASAGMTIIEKIEHYSNDADFALVLYTPCDRKFRQETGPDKMWCSSMAT